MGQIRIAGEHLLSSTMSEQEPRPIRGIRDLRESIRREQVAHGLWLWCEGAKRLERQVAGGRRGTYEAAVQEGVTWLQRYKTMPQLIHSYFDFAYLGENEVNEEGEDPFAAACRKAELARGNNFVLSATLVEDASYFRRLQQLIGKVQPRDER
jgi:hypothetical protein